MSLDNFPTVSQTTMTNNLNEQTPSIDIALSADVALAQSGDIQAYERLIGHSQNLVSSIALAIVKDLDDSEEVAQQVFISVWQNLSKLKNASSFLPWLRQSTRYAAFNFLRDSKSKSKVNGDAADQLFAQLSDPEMTSDHRLILENQNVVLHGFINKLADDEREIVLLYYREEQSAQQVAELLHLSPANVRKKLSRVRQALKSDLLKSVGSCVYSSAPVIGFSSMIVGLLVPSGPAAASIAASSAGASTKAGSSFFSKLAIVFGGAFVGAFVAVIAILWSSKVVMQKLPKEASRARFKQYRNETIAWVLLWACFITMAYVFSEGWLAPVLTYIGFAVGLIILSYRSTKLIHQESETKCKKTGELKPISTLVRRINYACLVLGPIAGLVAMLIGLSNGGRL